jgi:hypothetical protein
MFALHHGNVDRLWAAWRKASPTHQEPRDPAWRDHRFTFYGADGEIERPRVGDILDEAAIGYTFDRLDWRHTLPAGSPPAFSGGGQQLGPVTLSERQRARFVDQSAGASPSRILVQYERLQLPIHPLCHRLFLLHGEQATYCGTFTLLPIPDEVAGLDTSVSTQMEAPPAAVAALRAGAPVSVVAVPVQLKGRSIPKEPLRLDGVTLTLDS